MAMTKVFIWEDPDNVQDHYLHVHHSERKDILNIEVGGKDGDSATMHLPQDKLGEFIQALCKVPVHGALAGKLPVVCYFDNDADRDEFIAAVMQAKPGMRAVKP